MVVTNWATVSVRDCLPGQSQRLEPAPAPAPEPAPEAEEEVGWEAWESPSRVARAEAEEEEDMPERSPGRLCPTLGVARALARREARQEEGAEEAEEVAERPAPAEAPGSPEAQPARQSLPQDQPPSTVLDSSPGGSQTVDSRTIPHPESEAAREAVKRASARVSDWLSSSRKRLRGKQPHTWLSLAAIPPQTAPAQRARGSAEAREPEET